MKLADIMKLVDAGFTKAEIVKLAALSEEPKPEPEAPAAEPKAPAAEQPAAEKQPEKTQFDALLDQIALTSAKIGELQKQITAAQISGSTQPAEKSADEILINFLKEE